MDAFIIYLSYKYLNKDCAFEKDKECLISFAALISSHKIHLFVAALKGEL